jgi:hypothetical protein
MLVLRAARASRNRHFALHATEDAKVARRRAATIRGLVRDLGGAHGAVREVTCTREGGGFRLRYVIARVALARAARLLEADVAILRVALARRGVRLLPAAILATREDHAQVERLLAAGETALVSAAAP